MMKNPDLLKHVGEVDGSPALKAEVDNLAFLHTCYVNGCSTHV